MTTMANRVEEMRARVGGWAGGRAGQLMSLRSRVHACCCWLLHTQFARKGACDSHVMTHSVRYRAAVQLVSQSTPRVPAGDSSPWGRRGAGGGYSRGLQRLAERYGIRFA